MLVEGTTLATALVGRAGSGGGTGGFVATVALVRVITMAAGGGAANVALVPIAVAFVAPDCFFPSMRSAAARSHLAASCGFFAVPRPAMSREASESCAVTSSCSAAFRYQCTALVRSLAPI